MMLFVLQFPLSEQHLLPLQHSEHVKPRPLKVPLDGR